MGHTPFFSVVMPVYNVESYLKRAAESILNQTFGDLELILVDDHSPDRSGEIADEIASNDERVTVIHLDKNGGLSNFRIRGFDSASVKYILFMDSDDYVDKGLLKDVYDYGSKYGSKVIIWGLVEEYYDASGSLSYTKTVSYPETICKNSLEVRGTIVDLERETLFGYAWNKAYDLSYLREIGITFENITLIEDITFNVNFVRDADSMAVLNTTPYHYGRRIDNSLTNKFVSEYYELHRKRVEMVLKLYECWNMVDERVQTILANIYSRYIFSALQRNCDKRSAMDGKARRKWIENLFEDDLFLQLVPYMNDGHGFLKVLNWFLAKNNRALCLASGRFIYLVKTKMPVMFARAKHHR